MAGTGAEGVGARGALRSREFSRVLNRFWIGVLRHLGYGSQRRVGNEKLPDFWEALITNPVFAKKGCLASWLGTVCPFFLLRKEERRILIPFTARD